MSDDNCLNRLKEVLELAEREKHAQKEECPPWHDETFIISEIDDGHGHHGIMLPNNHRYFLAKVIIEGVEGKHTAVSTTLYVNGEPINPISSGDSGDSGKVPICDKLELPLRDNLNGEETKVYEYHIPDATTVKLAGYISSLNLFKGAGAKITLRGYYDSTPILNQ
ncbi:hypothetical protein [Xenorhabdus koppenhoeferi]|uniref:Inclusion body protein n=1 Tax=Xenorhabdus koppenhoeferi TaxID=351659 RepID=A0A1I7JHQ6_9GAMM|nr:hypothetical protein [Xenorhabdus koppenhoeferi]SFU84734.1 hypothetical protein SAMN05421784_1334 [Xenorhabdus koppenhoeferi]